MGINSLPDDPATLKGLLAEMATSQADQQQQIAQLEQRIRLLNLIIYGSKSEKKPRTGQEQQLSLFDEAEQTAEEQKSQTFEEVCAPAHTRRKRGRRPIPADLPRVEISYHRQSRWYEDAPSKGAYNPPGSCYLGGFMPTSCDFPAKSRVKLSGHGLSVLHLKQSR